MKAVKAWAVIVGKRVKPVAVGNGHEFQFPLFQYRYEAKEFIERHQHIWKASGIVRVEIREVKPRRKHEH